MAKVPGATRLIGLVGATAATAIVGLVATWEGKSNDPYFDIVKVQTVCYGETRVAMRHYTDAECLDQLNNGLADFAGPVLAISPELRGHPNQLAATVSLSYNIGVTSYRRSTVARKFRAGDWKGACDAFRAWRMAGGRVVTGLVRRREAERAICLRDLP